jgi:tetratricopeptide (TPR) repeat protein
MVGATQQDASTQPARPIPRKPGGGDAVGLVSRRVQMYEAPLNNARKGYRHRSQDSFHTHGAEEEEESRDEQPSAQAEIHRELAVAVPTAKVAPKNPSVPSVVPKIPQTYAGSALIESGVQYYNQGEYEKALKAFKTALKTQRVSVAEDDVCVALTLGNLGSVYLQQGNLDDAERVLQEALELKRALAPSMMVADILNNLGNCANLRGEHEMSLIYYEESLEDIREKKGRRADEINALFNIGRLEIQRQHWTKSMIALNEACRLAREHYGTNHACVAQNLDLMGFVQLCTSKLDAAMVSFTGALAIYRRLHGPLHHEVANALFNVGMVRDAKGDLSDAWEAYTTARDLYSRLGTEHDHPGFKTVRRSIANVEHAVSVQSRQTTPPKYQRKSSSRSSSPMTKQDP